MEDFCISNCITNYELKETIDYADLPNRIDLNNDDKYDAIYQNWTNKSQEVIEKIENEIRNP